ncbi:hypothetical protein HXA92_12280 [Listeria monocytogenes]|nr:hypothetical protein [Listeria monocytogenes]HBJ8545881.1 hypothetical protein [Listeria monocytogenes]HBJ8604344.1 hypothetical protein [Listeria monocytogenes]HEL8334704.1 hypothetical protein [Listeria monocytogenes]
MSEFDLKEYVKRGCAITWDDPALDEQIEEAKEDLRDIAGASIDFSTPGSATRLLKNRVRYERNGVGALFESDYRSELLRLQLKQGLKGGATNGDTSTD